MSMKEARAPATDGKDFDKHAMPDNNRIKAMLVCSLAAKVWAKLIYRGPEWHIFSS